jgi:hypothetical protein
MKKNLLLAFIVLFSSLIKAQVSYSITPAKSMTVTAPYSSVTIFDINQKNTSSSKIILKWKLVSMSLPPTWQYSMCDYQTCYSGIPAGPNTMDTIPGNGQGFLGLNIDPTTTSGSGVVKVYVYQNTFPANGDTLTWHVNTPAVGIEEIFAGSGIKIYPNPAKDLLTVDLNNFEAIKVNLFDALGRIVLTAPLSLSATTLNISALDKGFYTLVIDTKDKQLFKQIIKE